MKKKVKQEIDGKDFLWVQGPASHLRGLEGGGVTLIDREAQGERFLKTEEKKGITSMMPLIVQRVISNQYPADLQGPQHRLDSSRHKRRKLIRRMNYQSQNSIINWRKSNGQSD